jgi:MFS family permease
LHRAGDTAGAFIGLAIASLIIWRTQIDSSQLSRETFQALVIAGVIPAVLAVLILALGAREVGSANNKNPLGSNHSNRLNRQFWIFLGAVVVFTLGNSSDAFIILRGQERGLSVLQVMGMLLTFNAVYTLLSIPAGALSDRIGRRRVLLSGWVIYGLVYLGFAKAQTGSQVWLVFTFYGIFYALTEGVARAMVADLVPQTQHGRAYGLYHAGIGLAALPASIIAGMLWQGLGGWNGFGPAAPFYFGAGMALLAGVLLWRIG